MKKIALILASLALSACSTTDTASELPPIPSDATPQEAASYIAATCLGFAKAGRENNFGTELDIFNDCMNQAVDRLNSSPQPLAE